MKTYDKSDVVAIATECGFDLSTSWSGPGPVWPLIAMMMTNGATVVIKLDGQRQPDEGDNGNYTVIAQGGPLEGDMIRGDFEDLDQSLCYLIGNYFEISNSRT